MVRFTSLYDAAAVAHSEWPARCGPWSGGSFRTHPIVTLLHPRAFKLGWGLEWHSARVGVLISVAIQCRPKAVERRFCVAGMRPRGERLGSITWAYGSMTL